MVSVLGRVYVSREQELQDVLVPGGAQSQDSSRDDIRIARAGYLRYAFPPIHSFLNSKEGPAGRGSEYPHCSKMAQMVVIPESSPDVNPFIDQYPILPRSLDSGYWWVQTLQSGLPAPHSVVFG